MADLAVLDRDYMTVPIDEIAKIGSVLTMVGGKITVNRPAAEVWKRIGKYCDVAEWLQIPAGCTITSGKDGEFGAVRTVGAEVLVSRPSSRTPTHRPRRKASRTTSITARSRPGR